MSAPTLAERRAREHVLWHDLECGRYAADLATWRDLAGSAPRRVRDLGAGTGRVSLALARDGHEVEALDHDPVLLQALRERAAERRLGVRAIEGDVRDRIGGAPVDLVLAPMQTVQLLGGADGRRAMLAACAADLRPGGLLALAVAEDVEPFAAEEGRTPAPDVAEHEGTLYASRPVAVRPTPEGWDLERIREVVEPDGTRRRERDLTPLDRLGAGQLEQEAAPHGLEPLARRTITETDDHVGSVVVVLRRAEDGGRA